MIIVVVLSISFFRIKGWLTLKSKYYLLIIPLVLYLGITIASYQQNFWISHFFPVLVSVTFFALILYFSKQEAKQSTQKRLADELLFKCRAFDHGSWATSYLNQLQLFSVNLTADQAIPEKTGQQLNETITGFYDMVYPEIDQIQQLAQDAAIQIDQALELKRQLYFFSDNLNKVKVELALNRGISAEIWLNIHRLTDQIKMNIREINFGVTRFFSCSALGVIHQTMRNYRYISSIPISFPISKQAAEDDRVCIKSSELTAILENLFQNAQRAMQAQSKPQIRLSSRQTDQYFYIEVQDNGSGIPKKLWEKIFEQNYTTKTDGKAGGFGLYYSRKVLEKYGGNIEVLKSMRNRGTTFLIRLRRL